MLRTSSFLRPVSSGFVPFSTAAPGDAVVDADADVDANAVELDGRAEAAEVVARAAAPLAAETIERRALAVWMPASSRRIRLVEGAVVAAICGYFAYGLLRTIAGI